MPTAVWLAALVAALGSAAILIARSEQRRVEAETARLEAVEIAESAARLAAARLIDDDPRYVAALKDGRELQIDLLDGFARVTLSNEGRRLDLNEAGIAELQALFAALGAAPDEAARLAARVADYRDPDQLERFGGAEAPAYRLAGRSDGPRDGPFRHPSELALVLGMDEATARLAAARSTVWSTASDALPTEDVEALFDQFEASPIEAVRAMGRAALAKPNEAESAGRVYRVHASAVGGKAGRAEVTIIVAKDRRASPPFRVLERTHE